MSLDQAAAATLQGAATTEQTFQSLYDKGALSDGQSSAPAANTSDPAPGQQQATPSPQSAAVPESPQGQPDPAAQTAADEGPDYESVEDYLVKSNIDAGSFYELPVTVKIDGQTKQVKFSDVIKSYQLDGHVTQKSQALADQQRAFEAERQQAATAVQAQLTQANALGQLARQSLIGDYNKVDWQKLRSENPAEWTAQQHEFNQRMAAIDQHLHQVALAQQQQAQAQAQELQKSLPVEREKMFQAHPEWRDEKQFSVAKSQMVDYAHKLGFSDAELNGLFDHRYMQVLHDAASFAKLQASSPQAVKRVRTAPQVAQPGARTSRDPSVVARTQAKEAFQKNPRDQDAAARYFGTLS